MVIKTIKILTMAMAMAMVNEMIYEMNHILNCGYEKSSEAMILTLVKAISAIA